MAYNRAVRSLKAVLLAMFTVLVASGCGQLPPGADGDLVNDWPAMPKPVAWQPAAGDCHRSFAIYVAQSVYTLGKCADEHSFQTVHVGQVDGAGASGAKPPEVSSADFRALWADCDGKLTEYLGGQWRDRRLRLRVSLPTADSWTGGARWYSCEAMSFGVSGFTSSDPAKGSLKGTFETTALKFGCFDLPESGDETPKACDQSHNTEYAGFFAYDVSYADMRAEVKKDDDDATHLKCRDTVADFAAITTSNRIGTWVWNPPEEDWNAGDHYLRCFLWLVDVNVTKSMRNVGSAGWPLKFSS